MHCVPIRLLLQVGVDTDPEYIAEMEPVENRSIKIKFNADTGATMYVAAFFSLLLAHHIIVVSKNGFEGFKKTTRETGKRKE